MAFSISILAAADVLSVLTVVGALIAVIVLATVVLLFFRRRILAAARQSASAASVMEDMRRLHAEGKLSDAEFQAVRAKMAAKVRAEPAPQASSNPKRTKPLDAADAAHRRDLPVPKRTTPRPPSGP